MRIDNRQNNTIVPAYRAHDAYYTICIADSLAALNAVHAAPIDGQVVM